MPSDTRGAEKGAGCAGAPVDEAAFREVAGRFASGVAVVTAAERGQLRGTTASAVSSLSVDPPMMLVCLNRSSLTHGAVRRSGRYAINILAADQEHLARRFARKGRDKFADVDHSLGEGGLPLISGALATIECRVEEAIAGGSHTIFTGWVTAAAAYDAEPLTYFRGRLGTLHRPREVGLR